MQVAQNSYLSHFLSRKRVARMNESHTHTHTHTHAHTLTRTCTYTFSVCCSVLSLVVCYGNVSYVLQCVAVCCSALQCVVVCIICMRRYDMCTLRKEEGNHQNRVARIDESCHVSKTSCYMYTRVTSLFQGDMVHT